MFTNLCTNTSVIFYRTIFGLVSRFPTILDIDCSCCVAGTYVKVKRIFFYFFLSCLFLHGHDVHKPLNKIIYHILQNYIWVGIKVSNRSGHWLQLVWSRKLHQGTVLMRFFWLFGLWVFPWPQSQRANLLKIHIPYFSELYLGWYQSFHLLRTCLVRQQNSWLTRCSLQISEKDIFLNGPQKSKKN